MATLAQEEKREGKPAALKEHEDKPAAPKEPMKTKATTIAAWVLTLIYVAFGALLFFKFVLGDGPDKSWERALIIFNAVSAIGYAAVGVLLGTTVQQVNVANAKKDADKAKASENKLADRSTDLVKYTEEHLSKALDKGRSGDAHLWSGTLGGDDQQLRQAIRRMNQALAERSDA